MSQVPTARRFGALLVLVAASVPFAAAAGETKPPSDAAAPLVDGTLIYSRDVRHSIGAPYYPGPAHSATTAPTRAMVNTVNIGLAPLNDSENAAVTGSLKNFVAPTTTQLDIQLAGTGPGASGANALAATQTASAPGGAIGQAMGALSNALGSLSILTGGRP